MTIDDLFAMAPGMSLNNVQQRVRSPVSLQGQISRYPKLSWPPETPNFSFRR